jgi:hypothetical protein
MQGLSGKTGCITLIYADAIRCRDRAGEGGIVWVQTDFWPAISLMNMGKEGVGIIEVQKSPGPDPFPKEKP